jgi:hypothetical protein
MPVRIVEDHTAELIANLRELARYKLLVGIPEEKAERQDDGGASSHATNALIGFVAENGSPARNIPARPWLGPGIKAGQDQGLKVLKATATKALDGKAGEVEQGFNAAGIGFVNAVQSRIRSNIPPPLAPATIRNRRRRSKGSTYRRKATTAADVVALIDTGQFIRSVSYVVKKT